MVRARAARRRLTVDSLTQVLPASLVVRGDQAPHVTTELLLAATLVDVPDGPFAGRPKHPGLVIEALRQSTDGAPAGRADDGGAAGLHPARTPALVVVPGAGRA